MNPLAPSSITAIRRLHVAAIAEILLFALAPTSHSQVPALLHHQGRVAVDGVNFHGAGQFKFSLVDGGTDASRLATATATLAAGVVTAVTVTDGSSGFTSVPNAVVIGKNSSPALLQCVVSGGAVTGIIVREGGSGYNWGATVSIDPPPPNIVFAQFWSHDGTGTNGSEPTAVVSLPVTNGLFDVLLGDTRLENMSPVPTTVFAGADVRLRVWFSDGVHGFQKLVPDKRIAAVGYAMMADGVPDGAITLSKIADGAVGSAKLAPGAVGSAQLGVDAVQSSHIADGAVGSAQIAPGAITPALLASAPQSGRVVSSGLNVGFGQADFTVSFATAFNTAPAVTLGLLASVMGNEAPGLWVQNTTISSFTGRIAIPPRVSVPDRTGNVGAYCSLFLLSSGVPVIAYYDATNRDLKFVRATDASGSAWEVPITVDASGDTGYYCSAALIGAAPSIAYFNATTLLLKFVQATDTTGATWGTPSTVTATANVGRFGSLADVSVSGAPAITCYDDVNDDLYYFRGNAEGTSWSAFERIDGTGIDAGRYSSLAMVSSIPAVAYQAAGDLRYARRDHEDNKWNTPIPVDTAGADNGRYPSLKIVNGQPAISYQNATDADLRYVRALNYDGSTWGTPVVVASAGSVGAYSSLAVVDGRPAIAYYDDTNDDLKFVRALDVNGNTWGSPVTVTSIGDVGAYCSLVPSVGGAPAIAYQDLTNTDLNFARAGQLPATFSIQWIALEP